MAQTTTILSTRPIQPALKEKLLAQDIEITDYAFIETKPVATTQVAAVVKQYPPHYVFTSKTAVKLFVKALREQGVTVPAKAIVYCMPGETKKAVLAAGMRPLLTATSARQLAQMIVKKQRSAQVVFFCGDTRRNDLPAILTEAGITVTEVVVYKTILQPHAITHSYKAILFFSPSAVQSFFMSNTLPKQSTCFCIGETTAKALAAVAPGATIITADTPTQKNLLQKAAQLFTQQKLQPAK